MSGKCGNPYCDFPDGKMRSPTHEELLLWESQADEKARNQLDRGEVRLMICVKCGTWTAERWDKEKQEIVQGWVPSPFRFQEGDRLRVTLEGKTFGMVGNVIRRGRLVKAIDPAPVPENYYWVMLEERQNEESYKEDHLETCSKCGM